MCGHACARAQRVWVQARAEAIRVCALPPTPGAAREQGHKEEEEEEPDEWQVVKVDPLSGRKRLLRRGGARHGNGKGARRTVRPRHHLPHLHPLAPAPPGLLHTQLLQRVAYLLGTARPAGAVAPLLAILIK